MNKNGLLVVDNILWKGEVTNINSKDKLTQKIKIFNLHVKNQKLINIFFQLEMVFIFAEINDYNFIFL